MRSAILLLLAAACSSTSSPRRAAGPPPAPATWSVAFERSIGVLATAPVFAPDGGVVSSGQRFDRDGRYRGLLAFEVGGGRMIANVRALLSDGRALAEGSADGDVLMIGRADQPPEKATRRPTGYVGAIAVSPDERRAAAHDGAGIQIWSLPDLEPLERIEIGSVAGPGAIAFLPDGALAYSTPCRGAGCSGAGLEVRSARGARRRLREGGIESIALAPDAALIEVGGALEVIALPDGAPRGRMRLPGPVTGGITEGGALAIAPGGATAAALICNQLLVFARRGATWRQAYRGRMTKVQGEDGCAYPSGMAFSPDGASLAVVDRDLTVLRAGPARPPIRVDYRPVLPAGFAPTADSMGIYMPPPGTGLARAPRVIGAWARDGVQARAVVREAAEMSRFTDLDRWSTAILTRFEPMLRDDLEPNRLAADLGGALRERRAFTDTRGRRVLEYTILVRGGCEEMDRRVRWIEVGDALVEIDLESVPGVPQPALGRWLAAFFDAPLGAAGERRRIASARYNRGPC